MAVHQGTRMAFKPEEWQLGRIVRYPSAYFDIY